MSNDRIYFSTPDGSYVCWSSGAVIHLAPSYDPNTSERVIEVEPAAAALGLIAPLRVEDLSLIVAASLAG